MADLRFGGSVWCNIDVALRNLTAIYEQETQPLGLSVIEWYILRSLYEQDGQHPSQLAHAVGRPATSFTPLLDGLESKGLIERRPEPADRRAVRIYLTKQATVIKKQVQLSAERVEVVLRQQLPEKEWTGFQRVLTYLQVMPQSFE
jgi:DNA-binding MarR family transcriptional regulator